MPESPALAQLAKLEQARMAEGWGGLAAGAALARAKLLLEAGRAAEALAVAVPAVLALDSTRYGQPDAGRRLHNLPVEVPAGYLTAFTAAAACDEKVVIAELIEVARGNAMPRARSPHDRVDAASALAGTTGRTTPPGQGGGAGRTALAPPAALRTPWGTVALAEFLQQAERYLPDRRDPTVVEWQVRP